MTTKISASQIGWLAVLLLISTILVKLFIFQDDPLWPYFWATAAFTIIASLAFGESELQKGKNKTGVSSRPE